MLDYFYNTLENFYHNYLIDISIRYTAMIPVEYTDLNNSFKEILFINPDDLLSTIE